MGRGSRNQGSIGRRGESFFSKITKPRMAIIIAKPPNTQRIATIREYDDDEYAGSKRGSNIVHVKIAMTHAIHTQNQIAFFMM
jgi:hypothetical protein